MADELTPELIQKINDLLEKRLGLEEKLATYRDENIKQYENILSDEEKRLIEEQKRLELVKIELDVIEFLSKEKQAELGYTEDILEVLRKQAKELEKIRKQTGDIKEYTASVAATAEDALGRFFGINKQTEQLGKNLQNPIKYAGDLAKKIKDGLTFTNLMGSAATKFGEAMRVGASYMNQTFGIMASLQKGQEFYDQSRLISRQVGVLSAAELGEFQGRMAALADGTRFTRQEMMETYKTLRQSSAAFRQMSKADQEALTELSKTLERRLGVAVGSSAGALNELTQVFGKTPEQANKMTASMALMAKRMNLDVNKTISEFASQSNNLAKFGLPDVGKEFLNLSNIQDKVGIGMNEMIASLDKLSTFEGALTAGAQINAVFGTTIDMLEVMETYNMKGPVAGFLKLQEILEESGIQVDQMNRPQMVAYSKAIGMSAADMKKLGQVSTAELQRIAAEGGEVSDALQTLQKGQEGAETRAENLAKAQDNLAKAVNWAAEELANLQKWVNETIGSMGAFGTLLTSGGPVLIGVGLFISALRTILKLFGLMPAASVGARAAIAAVGRSALKMAGVVGGALMAYDGLKRAATGETTGEKALGVLQSAASGAMIGGAYGGLPGAGIGAVIGAGAAIYSSFEAEQNYISKPTLATVGEKPEMISHRTQRVLNTGDRVSGAAGGPTDLKLTINMVTKEGKVLETRQINKTLDKDIESTVNHILNEKLNLIFS